MFLDYQKNAREPKNSFYSLEPGSVSWVTIAVLILAGLAVVPALFVPRFSSGPADPKDAAKLDIHNIGEALEQFHTDNGRYPTTGEGLQALLQMPPGANLPGWKKTLDILPTDPWGHPYEYKQLFGAPQDYKLISYGPDGKPNTVDDISN
jgi:general secretion pathway protein G